MKSYGSLQTTLNVPIISKMNAGVAGNWLGNLLFLVHLSPPLPS